MTLRAERQRARFAAGLTTIAGEVPVPALSVTGAIPGWLDGTLLRNGPARFEGGHRAYRHWFDGLAMLHRFDIHEGQVSYANRFLDTDAYRAVRDGGRIGFGEFATDPCTSLFGRFFTRFGRRPSPNASVNVLPVADGCVALTETPLPVAFDVETLAATGVVGYDDDLAGSVTTAHPQRDHCTGDVVNYVVRFGRESDYAVYRQAHDGNRRELVGRFPVSRPAYMHSFALTARYAVLVEFPLLVNPLSFLLRGRPFIENYRWRPEEGTRFVVMDLSDGSVRGEYRTGAFFAFHHVNAYDDGDDIVVDLCRYDDAAVIGALYLDQLRANAGVPVAYPYRYRVDLSGGTVTTSRLADVTLELPTVADATRNRLYRYAYGVSQFGGHGDDFINQLAKVDTAGGAPVVWHEDGCYPGEPVFVAAPGATAEDDGVVLSAVLDSAAGRSFLLVLDAATFTETARAEVPHAMPFGFHGVFRRRRP